MRAANGVFMAELTKKCKRLWTKPGIRWLCGYFFVLLCGVASMLLAWIIDRMVVDVIMGYRHFKKSMIE